MVKAGQSESHLPLLTCDDVSARTYMELYHGIGNHVSGKRPSVHQLFDLDPAESGLLRRRRSAVMGIRVSHLSCGRFNRDFYRTGRKRLLSGRMS